MLSTLDIVVNFDRLPCHQSEACHVVNPDKAVGVLPVLRRLLFFLDGLKPFQVLVLAIVLAFIGMVLLCVLEQIILIDLTTDQLRNLHFARGFFSTSIGICFVWWIMHRKETELAGWRDHFSRKLDQRTSELNLALAVQQQQFEKLEASNNALVNQREDFVLALKLRLMTPVQAIQKTLNHLLEDAYGELTPTQREIVNLTIENNRDLDRLLVMLVALYRYQNGKLMLQRKMHKLLDLIKIKEDEILKAKKRNINLSLHNSFADIELVCDVDEARKVIEHLVDNAVKHAGKDVAIFCEVRNQFVHIQVVDDGPGIAPEDVENLFKRFYYVSNVGRYSASTGVGLCLCAEIAKAHCGTLTCESAIGQGTKFTLSLPLAADNNDSTISNC